MITKSRILLISAAIAILSLLTVAPAQTADKSSGGCESKAELRVILLSAERRYLLKEDPINVTVRAENCSKETVTIQTTPFFSFIRKEIGEERLVTGPIKYYGRVRRNWPRINDPISIAPGGIHEFYVDVTELEVMNVIWSVDQWYPPLKQLEKGDFEFRGAVKLEKRRDDGVSVKVWSSNCITIVSAGPKSKIQNPKSAIRNPNSQMKKTRRTRVSLS